MLELTASPAGLPVRSCLSLALMATLSHAHCHPGCAAAEETDPEASGAGLGPPRLRVGPAHRPAASVSPHRPPRFTVSSSLWPQVYLLGRPIRPDSRSEKSTPPNPHGDPCAARGEPPFRGNHPRRAFPSGLTRDKAETAHGDQQPEAETVTQQGAF